MNGHPGLVNYLRHFKVNFSKFSEVWFIILQTKEHGSPWFFFVSQVPGVTAENFSTEQKKHKRGWRIRLPPQGIQTMLVHVL